MARLSALIVAVMAVSAACRADTATQEPVREAADHAATAPGLATAVRVPANPVDRSVRRDLNRAITQDAELKQRDISFTVVNGDVSVLGTVRSEEERQKINELAINLGGVKSVANALRIAE